MEWSCDGILYYFFVIHFYQIGKFQDQNMNFSENAIEYCQDFFELSKNEPVQCKSVWISKDICFKKMRYKIYPWKMANFISLVCTRIEIRLHKNFCWVMATMWHNTIGMWEKSRNHLVLIRWILPVLLAHHWYFTVQWSKKLNTYTELIADLKPFSNLGSIQLLTCKFKLYNWACNFFLSTGR